MVMVGSCDATLTKRLFPPIPLFIHLKLWNMLVLGLTYVMDINSPSTLSLSLKNPKTQMAM